MGNIKQSRKGNFLQAAPVPSLEIALEEQLLTEVRAAVTKIDGVAGQVRDITTLLFGPGGASQETPEGRLFRQDRRVDAVERRSEANENAIRKIEARQNTEQASTSAHWSFAKIVWAFIAGCAIAAVGGGFEALISWALLRQH